jgi:uncharacterized membrane protein YciS (DUF1049 family)
MIFLPLKKKQLLIIQQFHIVQLPFILNLLLFIHFMRLIQALPSMVPILSTYTTAMKLNYLTAPPAYHLSTLISCLCVLVIVFLSADVEYFLLVVVSHFIVVIVDILSHVGYFALDDEVYLSHLTDDS